MFEKLKKIFGPASDEVRMRAQPIEMNQSLERALSRKEARLQRLLTIKEPTREIRDEIAHLTYLLEKK